MSESSKKIVKNVIQREKISVIIYPNIIFSILYGVWVSVFPDILNNYSVYKIIRDVLDPWHVGLIFIVIPILMLFTFIFGHYKSLLFTSNLLFTAWLIFSIAFILAQPNNTVWVFAAAMAWLSFSVVRRV